MDHDTDEIRALWPLVSPFGVLRDQFDPERVFANPFLDRVLGA